MAGRAQPEGGSAGPERDAPAPGPDAAAASVGSGFTPMGDEKDSWKVKTLDEILQEKKRRKEQEEKAEIKRLKNVSHVF